MNSTNTAADTAILSDTTGLNLADALINGGVSTKTPGKKRKTYKQKAANPNYRADRDGQAGVFWELRGKKGDEKKVWTASAGYAADGTRLRKSGFASAAEAAAWRAARIAEKRGARAAAVRDLNANETVLAAAAFDALDKAKLKPAAIEAAVAQYIARHPAAGRGMTVAQFHAEWLAQKKQLNRRPRTIVSAKSTFKPFLVSLGEKQICDVTKKDVRDIVFSAVSPRSQINRLLVVTNYFNEAAAQGYLGQAPEDNPCHRIPRPTDEARVPTPWNLQEAQTLLDVAWKFEPHFRSTAGVAVTLFAGLRTAEVLRSVYGPGGVDVERGHITVPANKAKKRRARVLQMEQNLLAILRAVLARTKESGRPITDGTRVISIRRLLAFRKKLEEAGLKWKHNGSRSAFGSYHYERGGDINRTIAAMGHADDADVFHDSYRGLVAPGDGEKFFSILPKGFASQPAS